MMVHLMDLIRLTPAGKHLTLCGGTGATKGHGLLERYSEDLDYTFAASALETGGFNMRLSTQFEIASRCERICGKMREAVMSDLYEPLREAFSPFGEISEPRYVFGARVMQMLAHYDPLTTHSSDYLAAPVKIEIGCRNEGKPNKTISVPCDIAPKYPEIEFPTANIKILDPEALFWDKIHICTFGMATDRSKQYRRSRHLYDLYQLDAAGISELALRNVQFGIQWMQQIDQFEKIPMRKSVDALSLPIQIVPTGDAVRQLQQDYNRMLSEGMLYGNPPSFTEIIKAIRGIETKLEAVIRQRSSK